MAHSDSEQQLTATIALPATEASRPALTAMVRFEIVGNWRLRVSIEDGPITTRLRERVAALDVTPAAMLSVEGEACGPLPMFNPKVGGWARGYRLMGIRAQETTAGGLLDPQSLTLCAAPIPAARPLVRSKDYEADLDWGTIGRTAAGVPAADQPVFASYRHGTARLDSIVLTGDGRIVLREGESHVAAPALPTLATGETRLSNLFVAGRIDHITCDHIFPILENTHPQSPRIDPPAAATLLPRTYAKLTRGESLRILAWGDSVTEASYLPNADADRWQLQLVARLRERFPRARIELMTEAWGGRNTDSYLAEPPDSLHNYQEKVLAAKPDLIVSEFVNDGGFTREKVTTQYGRLLADFRAINAEWIILTPHYVKPDWMGLTRQREIDDDPRAYVHGLHEFVAANAQGTGIALADASKRYGRLWRQGIPYMTLMLNAINHPNADGMQLFADSVMELF